MDRLRQLLLELTSREEKGPNSAGDSGESTSSTSRSHFTRRYQEQYGEQPQDTVARDLKRTT